MNYNLRDRQTADRLLDKIIRIHNTSANSGKLILLVEGKYDVPFYQKFCDMKYVYIHFTEGSEKMDSLVPLLAKRKYEYLAIQDSDFRFFGQQKADYDNLFFTDYHDYEMTCFSDDAFSQVFSDKVMKIYGTPINYYLIDSDLQLLSCYKACNMVNSLGVSFKLIDKKVVEIQNIDHVCVQSNIIGNLQQGYVNGFIKSNDNLVQEKFHLHNGHDWLNRICFHLNRIGTVDEENLQELLVSLYSKESFVQTQLYNDIVLWEVKNRKVWN